MTQPTPEAIERLEELAAWHRVNAEHAGSAWVWEARLPAAEDLERRAAEARARLKQWGADRQSGGFQGARGATPEDGAAAARMGDA